MAPTDHPSAEELLICEQKVARRMPRQTYVSYTTMMFITLKQGQESLLADMRFQTLVNYYRDDERFKDQPKLLTFFSGDAFNPSIESSITKGQ